MPDEPEHPEPPVAEQPTGEQPTPRDRLRGALLRPSRGQVVVGVLLALLGYAAVTQVRFHHVDQTYATLREQDLIDMLTSLEGTTQRADSEIAGLERTRDELRSDTGAREAALADAQERAETLAIMAGLVPVSGPGITVTITETEHSVDVDTMVDMIQELRSAGAEAIQVNHQVRVVAQTSFEDAVGGIRVGGVRVTSPYVVDVIGDPDALHGAIDFPKGPRDQFEGGGQTVDVKEHASLDIKSVVKPERAEYAEPSSSQ